MAAGTVSLIVAMDRNGVIGRDGEVPWRVPSDLRTFKTITMDKPVIMGRKTWESLPAPLPGRTNLVVTSRPDYEAEGAVVVHSPGDALARARGEAEEEGGEIMVAGGATIYRQFLPLADRIYLTVVETDVDDGDTHFPSVDWGVWRTVHQLCVDEPEDEHRYTFKVLRRR